MGNNPTPPIAQRSAPTFTKIPYQEGVPFVVGPADDPNAKRTRIVILSDTHRKHRELGTLPDGDILIHCGDWSNWHTAKNDTEDFNNWLKDQPHTLKIVVAGNHEINLSSSGPIQNQNVISNAVYLQGQEFIANGIKFWGGPWNPERGFTKRANAFSVSSDECAKNWSRMPEDVDILITHCPPYGVLDRKEKKEVVTYMGCPLLLDNVIRVTPTLHMFGHCHYESGIAKAVIDVRDVFASRIQRANSLNNNSTDNNNNDNSSKDNNNSNNIINNNNTNSDDNNQKEMTKGWTCKTCTFINKDEFLSCEACGAERTFEIQNVNPNVVFVNAANKFRMFPTIIDFYKVRSPTVKLKVSTEKVVCDMQM